MSNIYSTITLAFLLPLIVLLAFNTGFKEIGIIVFLFIIGFNFYMMRRNNKIYKLRAFIIEKYGIEGYKLLPSYEEMYNRFWIPVNRYKRDLLIRAEVLVGE